MKHYKETNGLKVYDRVFIVNHYDIEEAVILDIYDDYYSDDDDFICKWVKTDKGHDHLSDVFKQRYLAEYKVQNKKDAYDRYVTRGW